MADGAREYMAYVVQLAAMIDHVPRKRGRSGSARQSRRVLLFLVAGDNKALERMIASRVG